MLAVPSASINDAETGLPVPVMLSYSTAKFLADADDVPYNPVPLFAPALETRLITLVVFVDVR